LPPGYNQFYWLGQATTHVCAARGAIPHQRDTVATLLKYLADARAKEIEASDCDYAEKIELLGQYIYDDIWEPRPFAPLPPESSGAAN
jgi:hypothetical protein